jgi:hypothetical protein
LSYADDVSSLQTKVTLKGHTLHAIKEDDLEINPYETKYIFIERDHNTEHNHYVNASNKPPAMQLGLHIRE